MLQFALGSIRTGAIPGVVRAQQRVLLLTLGSHGTVPLEEVRAHLGLPGDVDVAVGTVCFVTDPL